MDNFFSPRYVLFFGEMRSDAAPMAFLSMNALPKQESIFRHDKHIPTAIRCPNG
jgi:hypothetical protein